MKAGYLGVPGAFSEMALLGLFKEQDMQQRSFKDFESMFAAVESEELDCAVIPVENTTTGIISRTYDLFQNFDVFAMGEINVPVSHNLICLPGARIEDIKEVYSHPEAISQCSGFLAKHPWIKPVMHDNTATSVSYIKQEGDISKAALASSRAAEIFRLPMLMEDVQNNKANVTRFLCISHKKDAPEGADKVSLMLTLPHKPGALYSALGIMASRGVNLVMLQSRPIVGKMFEYFFYMDIQGNLGDENVKAALEELGNSAGLKIIGNYRAAVV